LHLKKIYRIKDELSKLNGDWLILSRFTGPHTDGQVAEMAGILTVRAVSYPPGRMQPVHLKSDARESGISLRPVDYALNDLHGCWPKCGFVHARFRFLVKKYPFRSDLFFDAPSGFRRFASHAYLTLACYRYGPSTGDLDAIEMARSSTHHLIKLQGPQGVWPGSSLQESGATLTLMLGGRPPMSRPCMR
jgi:hypothetical protein